MISELPIEKGTDITIVNSLGVATSYKITRLALEIQQRYDMLWLSFVEADGAQKNLSLYADQIKIFNTETKELIDIYA